jgi:ParB family chromosome partitioning protein
MRVIDIALSCIDVGERRRDDYGDIGALAKGLKRIGLLEPIIVDRATTKDRYRLVAGARRLKAAQMLKWNTIPASLRGNLTDEELRDIELEENENRKQLKAEERRKTFRASKQIVENAKKAAAISSTVDEKKRRGRKAKSGKSHKELAADLGVSEGTLVHAEQHVDIAERFPWLQSDAWIQADVRRFRRALQRIPPDEHETVCQFIQQAAWPLDPRPDRVIEYAEVLGMKTPEERAHIFRLWESADERNQSLARTRALHRPPMPDVRSRHIHEALLWLKKAVKPPFDAEPEVGEFRSVIKHLDALSDRIEKRYEALKRKEAEYVEEDIRRRQKAVSA